MDTNTYYVIINHDEISSIDFSQTLINESKTVRTSLDKTKILIKYQSEIIPSSIMNCLSTSQPYNHEEILAIMNTPEWTLIEPIPTGSL
jgi:hypothetical protein